MWLGINMTLFQLIKKLQKLEGQVGPRAHVVFEVKKIVDNHNDDYTHSNVKEIEADLIRWSVDDNWELADGSERMKRVVVLS